MSLSFSVNGALVPVPHERVAEWGFLQDYVSDWPGEDVIPWTYSTKEQLEAWMRTWDEVQQWLLEGKSPLYDLRPLSSVWSIAAFMRPNNDEWVEYFYIDRGVPRTDRLGLYRSRGRALRALQSEGFIDGEDPMGFVRGAQTDQLKECIHNNLYLWLDPISYHKEGWQLAGPWYTSDYDQYKERLLNIDFLNIASAILYQAWKRYLSDHGFLPSHTGIFHSRRERRSISTNYDSTLVQYRREYIAPRGTKHPLDSFILDLSLPILMYQEVPFDLILWDDLHDFVQEKWFYLSGMSGPDFSTLGNVTSFLEGVEVGDEEQLKRVTYMNRFKWSWSSLYLALAGREVDKIPGVNLKVDALWYHQAGQQMGGVRHSEVGREVFTAEPDLQVMSVNLPLLYDTLLPPLVALASDAAAMGLQRLIDTDRKAPNYTSEAAQQPKTTGKKAEFVTTAWSLVVIINNWVITQFTGSATARVKPKDTKKLVTYMGARLGYKNLLHIAERFITLAEQGVAVPLEWCAEVVEESSTFGFTGFSAL